MLYDHTTLSDKEFECHFATCTLNPELFNHEAHLRLAWIHVKNYGIDTAIKNICSQLLNYVNALGASEKYNQTLTIAAVRAVYHFMLKSKSDTFAEFITEFPRLKSHFRALMQAHYSLDIFKSKKAKATYLQPDLLPFD